MVDYLGSAVNVLGVYNHGTFREDIFGNMSIEKTSTLHGQFISTDKPTWSGSLIQKHALVDQVDFIQIGQVSETEFEKIHFEPSLPSSFSEWPKKEAPKRYKISSFWIELDSSMTTIER